jgi:hypothetical protein
MGDNNEEIPEVNDHLENNQPWLDMDSLALPGRLNHLPRHPEKLLPKFDPKTSGLPEDHIKKFIFVIRIMNVQHEDMFLFFPYTFEKLASTWYFNLPFGSISSWEKFQKYFLDKFTEEMTIRALMAQCFTVVVVPNEKFKEFNQRFITILKKFQTYVNISQEIQIEVYDNALLASISMFVKRVTKPTLAKKFEEEKIIEFQMKCCKDNQISLSKKEMSHIPRRGVMLTIPPRKQVEQQIEKGNVDMESLQRMVKKFSNKIVDMKITAGEGTSNLGPYKSVFRKKPTIQRYRDSSC